MQKENMKVSGVALANIWNSLKTGDPVDCGRYLLRQKEKHWSKLGAVIN